MKYKIIHVGVGVMLTLFSLHTAAQKLKPLKVNDKVPANLWKTIPKKSGTKLVLLDFWSTHCATCIASFPKLEKLQLQFDKEFQVVLINTRENEAEINTRFAKINKNRPKDKWLGPPGSLAAINQKSIYEEIFPYFSVPHHVWLDGQGKVLAISNGYNATAERIQTVLKGGKLELAFKNDSIYYTVKTKGIWGTQYPEMPAISYCAFMEYFGTSQGAGRVIDSAKNTFRITERNNTPLDIFREAFRDKNKRDRVVIEIPDKNRFQWPEDPNLIDEWTKKNWFTYEIQGMLKDQDNWRLTLRQNANLYFGSQLGIEAGMETRKYNSLVLIKTKGELLTTSGKPEGYHSDEKNTFQEFINTPFEYVVNVLAILEDLEKGIAFVDETGFTGNVDIKLVGDLRDIQNVRNQIRKYGLDIIEAERDVEVLVIKEKKK